MRKPGGCEVPIQFPSTMHLLVDFVVLSLALGSTETDVEMLACAHARAILRVRHAGCTQRGLLHESSPATSIQMESRPPGCVSEFMDMSIYE